MGKYTRNGGVVSSKLPVSTRDSRSHTSMFGIYRGIVLQSVYPDDPKNITKNRMEYKIRVRGQDYPNAINLRVPGGIYNYSERVRKGVEKSTTGNMNDAQYNENLDGEHIFVMFIDGNGDVPLIVGGDNHSRVAKKLKKEDGLVNVDEFNGLEFKTDKDSHFTITQTGRKDPEGKILNKDAVGSIIKMDGKTGDIALDTSTGVSIKFTKKTKILQLLADKNEVLMNADGVKITDESGNVITMKSGEIDMTIKGDFNVNADGKASINAKGGITEKTDGTASLKGTAGTNVGDSGSPTNVDGQIVNLAGGGAPVARLGDMVVGTGNLGVPVVSQILQGSPKVTAG